jgi:hypothetical protein
MASNKLTGMAREVAEKYRETLVTLTFNNKIVINTLTEIAKEDTKYANVIVDCIEARLRKVPADQMLPLMYLIDSICKNHGSPYKEMFNTNLVSNFAHIFQQVSEKAKTPKEIAKAAQVRSLLYKLRLTWGGSYQVFTPTVLHQLDVKIKKIDPAWPVTHPKPAPSAPVPLDRSASNTKIHVNPNFVSKTVKEKTPPMEDETERMRAELLKKEAELIKLKQMQLDMQILQLKKEMPGQKPVTDGSTISSTTPGLTPERKSPSSSVNSSSALPLPQAEKSKKVRCLLLREANISYSIQIIKRELINGLSHSDLLRFDISPPVIQSLARLILKLDRGPCFHERNTLLDNNELFLKWIQVIPSTVYRVLSIKLGIIS